MTASKRPRHRKADSLHEQLVEKAWKKRAAVAERPALVGTSRLFNDLLPQIEISHVPVADLQPPSREVRKLIPSHIREVAASISRLGFCVPVLIGEGNCLIDGVIRWEAARRIGLPTIPCIRIDHLSRDQQRVLRLAINRMGEKGEWDLEELKAEFEELQIEEAPLDVSGFSLAEIDDILAPAKERAEKGPLSPAEMPSRLPDPEISFAWVSIALYVGTAPIQPFSRG